MPAKPAHIIGPQEVAATFGAANAGTFAHLRVGRCTTETTYRRRAGRGGCRPRAARQFPVSHLNHARGSGSLRTPPRQGKAVKRINRLAEEAWRAVAAGATCCLPARALTVVTACRPPPAGGVGGSNRIFVMMTCAHTCAREGRAAWCSLAAVREFLLVGLGSTEALSFPPREHAYAPITHTGDALSLRQTRVVL